MDAEVSKEIKSSLYENVFQGVIFKSMRHNDLQVSFAHFSFPLVHYLQYFHVMFLLSGVSLSATHQVSVRSSRRRM